MNLYRLARLWNDVKPCSRGGPTASPGWAKNKAAGRLLGRLGVWRRLWRSGLLCTAPSQTGESRFRRG